MLVVLEIYTLKHAQRERGREGGKEGEGEGERERERHLQLSIYFPTGIS